MSSTAVAARTPAGPDPTVGPSRTARPDPRAAADRTELPISLAVVLYSRVVEQDARIAGNMRSDVALATKSEEGGQMWITGVGPDRVTGSDGANVLDTGAGAD